MIFTKAEGGVAWFGTVLGFIDMLTSDEIGINGTASIFVDVLPIASLERVGAQSDVFRHQAAVMLFCGLVLGILTEISRSVFGKGEE